MAASVNRDSDTAELLELTRAGDLAARQRLLARDRDRLRRMVEARLDRRLAGRLDPSDIVQDALADAARKLDDYLNHPPLPFYPWLRQFAWEHVVKAHGRHLRTGRRSVTREAAQPLPDESEARLAELLATSAGGPSAQLLRAERRDLVRSALKRLDPRDREVLVLRYLEDLSTAETAAVLEIGEGAVKMRHLRALERLRKVLGEDVR